MDDRCSYGFRPGRSAHDALEALWKGLTDLGGGWIIDLDIRKFFDTLDKNHLREILKRRVRDGVLLRLIGKWLKAGVLEDGAVSYPERGTPQGGVISPILSNIYLHDVLDRWFANEVKPRLKGKAFLIRFADDALLVFARKEDAERVMEVLPKRFGKYGLTIHPEKTRLIWFGKPQKREEGTCQNHLGGRSSAFWALHTTGGGVAKGRGWSRGRRNQVASRER